MTIDEKNVVQGISQRASKGTPILDAIQEEVDRYQKRIDEDRAEIAKIDKQIAKLKKQDSDANRSKIERLEGSKDYRQGSIERRSELKRVAQNINPKDF